MSKGWRMEYNYELHTSKVVVDATPYTVHSHSNSFNSTCSSEFVMLPAIINDNTCGGEGDHVVL